MTIDYRFHALVEAVQNAGQAVLRVLEDGFETTQKSNRDPVTTADLQANQILRKALIGAFPEYGWLSEETRDDSVRLKKRCVWIVDPIDGTKEFVNGIPEFAISVALVQDGQPIFAAVFNPATDELFSAARGAGAWLNGERIQARQQMAERLVILASRTEYGRGNFQSFEDLVEVLPVGSVAYKLALTAAGRADGTFSLEPKNEWDVSAGVLLVEESGGKITDNQGKAFLLNQPNPLISGVLAASGVAYDRVQALLQNATGSQVRILGPQF